MPSVLDYARAQDPALKDVPDDKLIAYIRATVPDLASALPTAAPRTAFQKQAAANKLGLDVQTHAADMESEIGTAKGKAAGDIGQGLILGGAALATGGLGAAPAAALMGTAGVAGATAQETAKAAFGSSDLSRSPKELALHLGLEGALSAGGEAGIRALGMGLKYVGNDLFPSLVMRSAAKAEAGQQALVKAQQDSFDQLRTFVRDKGTPAVDIGQDIADLFGAIRKRATGTSQAFKDATKPVFAKLWKAAGPQGSIGQQPLDALMEIKTDLSHIAYKVKGMNSDEMVALRTLSDQVDKKIVGELQTLGGPAAKKVYANYKAFTEQIKTDGAILDVAETGLKKFLGKAAGYIPGVDTGIDTAIRGKAAPWVLEQMYSNPKTAALIKDAYAMVSRGDEHGARRAFEAAINASGVGTTLKDFLKSQKNPISLLEQQPSNDEAIMPAQTAGP
jgi:hypothetical protein